MHKWIDPDTMMRIKSLELRARYIVEGLSVGFNRSPFHGLSVEFTEYRAYTPGDDLRFLDWKLFARSDRYYVKKFEDETNLICHILVDASRSMDYGTLAYTKSEYARTLAGTLAHFLLTQRNAVGVCCFDSMIRNAVIPRRHTAQLRRILAALEYGTGGDSTDLDVPLQRIAEMAKRRGLIVLISDFLSPLDHLQKRLSLLRVNGQDVVIFHIQDPAERDFSFQAPVIFKDLETGREMFVDPQGIRDDYLRQLEAHCESVESACRNLGLTYQRICTDQPFEEPLLEFLLSRCGRSVRASRSYKRTARSTT